MGQATTRKRRRIYAAVAALVLGAMLAAPALAGRGADARGIVKIARQVMRERGLEAVIVRVDRGRRTIVRAALGQSIPGVPATAGMHFRLGSMSIPLLTTLLLQLEQEGRLSLDDPLAKWLPSSGYPNADRVTLGMLARSTSGYPDWIQGNPTFVSALLADPFRTWTESELLGYAFAQPIVCTPGSCFHYAHTNFTILGQVIRKVTGKPLVSLVHRRIFRPLRLGDITVTRTAKIPAPVLHAYGTNRGVYEDTTSWSPSWGLGRDQLMNGDIDDVIREAAGVLSGRLLSPRARRELVTGVPVPGTDVRYAVGLVVQGGWRIQNPSINGYGGIMAYLPSKRLSVAIESTNGPHALDDDNGSMTIFTRIAAYLSPRHHLGRLN